MPILIKRKSAPSKGKEFRPRRSFLALLAIVQLPITLGLVIFVWLLVTSLQYQGFQLKQIGLYVAAVDTFESIRAYRFPVAHWLGIAEEMPVINLDVKQGDYRKLEYAAIHDEAINDGLIDGEKNLRQEVYVKADVRFEDEKVPVKIRLKGDRRVHWTVPELWSFRVEVRGDRSLLGMRKFSLQKPITRNYIYEWFFHKILKREGLIGLRYDFVELNVNGKSQGVYAIEEHFDKVMLENNNRREAPILRFAEAGIGLDKDWYQMPVSPYGKKRWVERNPEMLARAANLLEDFQGGRKSVGEVFDVQLLARYFAIIDLLDSFHGALAKSVKFYYNPINNKLEPIGFDAHFNDRKFPVLVAELSDFRIDTGYSVPAYFNAIFGPDIHEKVMFWEAYVSELERISEPAYLDQLFAEIGPELDEKLDAVYAEVPWHDFITGHPLTTGMRFLFYFSENKFYERQSMIRQRLYPAAAVTSYIVEVDEKHLALELANAQKLPLEILEVVHNGILYKPEGRILLNEKPRYAPMDFESHNFVAVGPAPQASEQQSEFVVERKPSESAVRYRVPGARGSREHELFAWVPANAREEVPVMYNRYMKLTRYEFLEVDDAANTVTIKPGYWKIVSDVVIPEGYTVIGQPGTIIDLLNGSRFVSFSPLLFTGTELDPIVVTSTDKTGKGTVVLEAEGRSTLQHVHFSGMTLADGESWSLTSAVTFHRSDVDLDYCSFGNNQSEDALNIVRSNFTISNSYFENTFGDAFDSDFSNGRVDDTRFIDIGNDAIDVSGTEITVRQSDIRGAGDKGISVGEASRMQAEFVTIVGANIGVAAKDLSYFEGMTLTIRDANVGFALFQKKPEYGPASAGVWRTQLRNVREEYWLEEGSSLSWEGVPVVSNRSNLKAVLYAEDYVAEAPPTGDEVAEETVEEVVVE